MSKIANNLEEKNKAGYTATPVACVWAGAVYSFFFIRTSFFGQVFNVLKF